MPPRKNTEYIFYISLAAQSQANTFQSSPTIAAGDFKVSIDGGALTNPATLPAVTPAASKMVKVTLSTAEMNGDNITFVGSDAAGAEWRDITVNIQTSAQQIDDLATAAALTVVDDFLDTELAALTTAVGVIDDFLDTEIAAIKVKTDNLPAAPAAVSNIPTAAQIADAVLDDPIIEPTATFVWAGATLRTIIGWLGALGRNKMTQTATTSILRNDADSGNISTATVSDDATTFVKGEWS